MKKQNKQMKYFLIYKINMSVLLLQCSVHVVFDYNTDSRLRGISGLQ